MLNEEVDRLVSELAEEHNINLTQVAVAANEARIGMQTILLYAGRNRTKVQVEFEDDPARAKEAIIEALEEADLIQT